MFIFLNVQKKVQDFIIFRNLALLFFNCSVSENHRSAALHPVLSTCILVFAFLFAFILLFCLLSFFRSYTSAPGI